MNDSTILNGGINIIHVLKAPNTTTNSLRDRKVFLKHWRMNRALLNWKKYWYKRKANTLCIIAHLLKIRYSLVFTPISLIKKAIYFSMKHAKRAGLSFESKRNIIGSVSSCFNYNQLSQC
jgi:hypothetical protein